MPSRYPVLILVFAALVALLTARLFQLQVLEGEQHVVDVEESREVVELLPAMRGRILDRNGTAIADNRAAYHLGVRLAELELGWRARRAATFLRLDENRFDALVADLSLRLPDERGDVRAIVTRELIGHIGVAVRHRKRTQERKDQLALLAIPRAAFAGADADDDADEDDDGGRSGIDVLAEDSLAVDDPREALVEEARLRWGVGIACLTDDELTIACERIDRDFAVHGSRAGEVLRAFARRVTVRWPGPDPLADDDRSLSWWLLADDRRGQAEAALARFLGRDVDEIAQVLSAAIAAASMPPPPTPFFWAAAARDDEVASLLPAGQVFSQLEVSGLPSPRERVFIIQDDLAGQPGLAARLQNRLADSLGAPGEWVGALLARHAERIRARTAERDHRLHQLVLDAAKVERLIVGLSQALTAAGAPKTAIEIEQALSAARRIADKEWAGQTRHDAIAIVRDVPHGIATALAGAAAAPPPDIAKRYEDCEARMPGLAVIVASGRDYPFPGAASHTIGTLMPVSADKEFEEYKSQEPDPGRLMGSTGLERRYDARLTGVPGKRIMKRDHDGMTPVDGTPPLSGQDLVTELDIELQLIAEDALKNWFDLATAMEIATEKMQPALARGAGRAGLALIDCHTGAILTLASVPGYRIDELRTRYAELADRTRSPGDPLHDHACEAAQPPGSAVKIATALAGLKHKVMVPGERIYSPGYMAMTRGGQKILRDHAPAGMYDLVSAIQVSSNVYFATIGDRLGGRRLTSFFALFNLGVNNALDVDQQRTRLRLHTPDNIAQTRPLEPTWRPSDTWRMSIGQYQPASPLQVVTIAAAVANGGHVVRPYLVVPEGGPDVVDLDIRKDYLEVVRRGMEAVTDNRDGSTAKWLQLEGAAAGIKVAAKTGTSEWGSIASREKGETPDHSWLIGYAPADRPVVAFALFIHCGTGGGRACSPVAKKLLEAYFTKYGREGHAAAMATQR
ncbi:MAG TPA: penicillin-binding transpeptidase domain-containing protein [Planctomycetota bacterium]|nr:penicillin-binding transpeptidase domain-containing protein [Planctomycetota bacterium]